MNHAGKTSSAWMASASLPAFTPLDENTSTDVVIVGAGIAGLSTAYELLRAGRSVIVLDDGPVAAGESERTTAHLASALDDRFYRLERLHGARGAQLAAESHAAAIDAIERIVAAEKIDCQFERLDGYLFAAEGESQETIQWEYEAAQRAGLLATEFVSRAPMPRFNSGRALLFPRQGQFHPLRYLAGLAAAIVRRGGRIHPHTHVCEIKGGPAAAVVTTRGAVVSATAIVVATNTPVNDRLVMHTKQAAYRTYAIGATVPKGSVPRALYWDTADPYHYVRLQPNFADGRELLIVGGEDHKTGQEHDAGERFEHLRRWALERFPIGEVMYRWSGQVMEPVDSLAFIGRNPLDHDNVYIVTGDSGHGLTHGTIAGLLLTGLITSGGHAWSSLYDPARKSLGATGEFARETANMAAQYRDWLTSGDVATEDEIPAGAGAVIRRGLSKVAVYRSPTGELHECSAVCPHLGGIVRWNAAEETWDCPCHGSRFDAHGQVLNGPAISDLHPIRHPVDVHTAL